MAYQTHRRDFLKATAAATATFGVFSSVSAAEETKAANDKIVIGVMGVNGRGSALAMGFAQRPNVEIAYICDVDSRAIAKTVEAMKGRQEKVPTGVEDFRTVLDDKSVDVLVCAAPNHWHAPATILGCSAGKHVYVEKPCSHTAWEGEMAVKAARKNDRVVQMGNQRRSSPFYVDAIKKLHDGAIGKILFARSWYDSRRGSIGAGKEVEVPDWLNYELWQGPVTERPFKDNLIHYNWHWHWHWGNGELGNNGIHSLDLVRWGLNVDYPTRVTSAGGRYRWKDDQETADTHIVTYEFGDRMCTWEGLSWSPRDASGSAFGVSFHGEDGQMTLLDSGYQLYDIKNNLVEEKSGGVSMVEHFDSFLGCIRGGGHPTSDIEDAHKSTLLCHLGNIALRSGKTLDLDPQNGHILGDEQTAAMWTKEYRESWTPTV